MKPKHFYNLKQLLLIVTIHCILIFSNSLSQERIIYNANGESVSIDPTKGPSIIINENGQIKSLTPFEHTEMVDIIVTFQSTPLCIQKSNKLAKTADLSTEHKSFISKLQKFSSALNKTNAANPSHQIKREFFNALNGVSLKCSKRIFNYIESMPMVKSVHENIAVEVYLDNSVAQIKADKVRQQLGFNGNGVLIGVVDTGIDYIIPALGGGYGSGYRVIGGYDFSNDDSDPVDDHGHGTHVAGIIGANSDSLKGVAPAVSFLAAKVLNKDGRGTLETVLAGIEYCMDPDGNPGTNDAVDIINMSLGGPVSSAGPVDEAFNNATQAGILSVVAAGNSGDDHLPWESLFETIGTPGTAESALTVGACDSQLNVDVLYAFQ